VSTTRRYGDVLRTPHVARLLGTALIARSTIGLDGLAIVLFLKGVSGSYAIAGTAAAAFAAAAALAGPIVGRLIDRLGARRVLVPVAFAHAAGLLAIIALGEAGVTWAAVLAAFVAGAAIPPVGSILRALWPELLADRPELVTVAYALDATIVELVFVLGPLVVALAYALSGPELALVLSAAMAVGGTLLFVSAGPAREYHPASDHAAAEGIFAVLRGPGMKTLVATTLPIGFCLGASEVSFPAFGESIGNRGYAGLLIAVWSLGSAAGGFLYGARPHTRPLPDVYIRVLTAVPLVTLPLAAASSLAVMLPLALLAGVTIAPTFAAGNELVGHVAPPAALTEAYTWPLTTMVAGVAIGNAVAGGIIELSSWRVSFAIAAAVGALGAVIAWSRRDTLGPVGVSESSVPDGGSHRWG
jgi:MFS family permease